jgi:type IV pilus assembly protein PilW
MKQVVKQSGFSVLELLIALTLGLVVVAGIIQLFTGNSRTYEIVNAQARLQENARYSFQFITRAARTAGYRGCAPEPLNVAKGLIGGWDDIPEYNLRDAIDGFEANGDGTYGPTDLVGLPRSTGGVNSRVHIAGNGVDRNVLDPASDIMIFRSLERPLARLAQTLQPTGDPIVQTPNGVPSFAVNDVVVVADCEQAAMFKVTTAVAGADETTLEHTTVAAGNAFDNGENIVTEAGDIVPATLSLLGRSYGAEAVVARIETTIFFVAPSTQLNNANDSVNSLWQKSGNNAPIELVQGVDNLQVLYGIDSTPLDGVANVNRYQTIDNVADLNAVVAVRVALDVNSVDALAELGGNPLRRSFSKTISLRNTGV